MPTWKQRAGFGGIELLTFLRAATAAVLSLLIARSLSLPEYYWAPISTLVVLVSTTNPLESAWQRFVGTALGASLGAAVASFTHTNWQVYGVSLFACGALCYLFRIPDAYRISAITLSIILLVNHGGAPWRTALHRFIEVSVGIAVALLAACLRLPQTRKV